MKSRRLFEKSIVFAIIQGLTLSSVVLADGTRGGGNPQKIDAAAIELLLQGGGLKKAMLNYLSTIQVAKVSDPLIKTTFARILRDGDLQKDINVSGNYVPGASCADAFSNAPASAKIGEIGGEICFDTQKLAQAYSALSPEEAMIRLASLAFHEHVHHFQEPSTGLDANEKEAYGLAAYVQLTARVAEIPVLQWAPQENPRSTPRPFVEGTATDRAMYALAGTYERISAPAAGESKSTGIARMPWRSLPAVAMTRIASTALPPPPGSPSGRSKAPQTTTMTTSR